MFKDAGEFFDNVSNAEAEPTTTDDVVFEKEISKPDSSESRKAAVKNAKLTPQNSDSPDSRKPPLKNGKAPPQNSDPTAFSKLKLNHEIQIKRVKKEISEQITLNESPKHCEASSDTDLDLDLGDKVEESFPERIQTKLVQDILTNIRSDRSGDDGKEVEPEKTKETTLRSVGAVVLGGGPFQIDKLGGAIDEQARATIEKLQILVGETLKGKSKEVEGLTKEVEALSKAEKDLLENRKVLESENFKLKQQFKTKVKVKQEVFDENIEKTKVEYDEKLKNIDEERDYMIDELKVKDDELQKRNEEIKQKTVTHERKVAQLQRNLKEKEKLLQISEEKVANLESRIARFKKKPPQNDLEKKLLEVEGENDKLKELEAKSVEELAKLEEQKYNFENKALEKELEARQSLEKKAFLEKDMEEQRKSFQRELMEMHSAVKMMRNEQTSNEKMLKTKDVRNKELEGEVNAFKKQLKTREGAFEKMERKMKADEDASKIAEEYKLDLESKISENDETLQKQESRINALEVENKIIKEETQKKLNEKAKELEDVIMQDLDIIEKDRNEISGLKNQIQMEHNEMSSLKYQLGVLEREISSSEDEKIGMKRKEELMRNRLVEVAKLKVELESKVETLENTNFMLDMKVKEKEEAEDQKKEEVTEMTNKVFLLEMKVMEKDELEKANEEKIKTLTEEKNKEKEEIVEKGEKEKKELNEKMVSLKEAIMKQIREIQKSGKGRIYLDMCECLDKTFPKPTSQEQPQRGGRVSVGQGGGQGVGQGHVEPGWECSTCTYLNSEESQNCGMCSKSREPVLGSYIVKQTPTRRNPPSPFLPKNNMAIWEGSGRSSTGYHGQEEDDGETIEIID